ncbi:MAG: DUF2723 domain-containing protein [Bacteroidales bacterium]|nr:DUF2723 domain-containing protein [Bacteroidales bacterium]
MTINYKKFNNLIGWFVFAIATFVYILTLEPTTGWWDCGEYISTAYKLEVGHPPGAPLFQLLGRFFSLFAFGDTANVAYMINLMSALSSSFTVLFLFWTITILAKKLVGGKEMNDNKAYAIFASGAIGALAFTFTDSFWFSAVEGEVYAMSSLFTAVVFWAILKWEEVSDTPYANRWIILIAYLMGLSIGVHLLNLLAIPAITYIVYFKKYKKIDIKGFVLAGLIGIMLLAFIMYLIIPTTVRLAGAFELFFVNSLGLPFNSGSLIFFITLTGIIVWAWKFTYKRRYKIAHLAIISTTFIFIGYSSFFMIAIRANANPPINENDPKDAIGMLSYLLREQYGSWPLAYGQYYNANSIEYDDGSPVYVRDEEQKKYIITDERKGSVPVYNPELSSVFPRMWSNREQSHISVYKTYQDSKGKAVRVRDREGKEKIEYKPAFSDNLSFFFRYQMGHMYFRYFMWNFVGRQNDIEAQPNIRNGNWISGIDAIDSIRLGNQDQLPDSIKNPATNKFYFLPLILGLIGLIFHLNRNMKDFWVVFLLFLMTGMAIIVYLNFTPFQPRERDYAYAGSYYAFAIWIGLGVLGLIDWLSKKVNMRLATVGVFVVTLVLVPGIMASEGWDDHDRSGKTAARDFAFNYLNSCEPNAILFVNGDNDTFPLWYAQEVEGVRTDMRVANYMLASGPWYVHQLQRKIYDSEKVPLSIPAEKYNKGVNSFTYIIPKVTGAFEIKEIIDFIQSDDKSTKHILPNGEKINYMPTRKVKLTLDSAYLVESGVVPLEKAHLIPKELTWSIGGNGLYKNDLMLLDFLATNNWERPIYFANPNSVKKVLGLDEYMHLEGFVYRFLPYKAEGHIKGMGGVNPEKAYDLLVNNAVWGNLEKDDVSVDRESTRNSRIAKNNFKRVADALIEKGEMEKAIIALDSYEKFSRIISFPTICICFIMPKAIIQQGLQIRVMK